MHNLKVRIFFNFFFLILAISCSNSPGSLQEKEPVGISVPAQHLVFIGFDGWGGAYVQKAEMPTIKQMIAGGVSTLDMRCLLPSDSITNWPSLFSGTPQEHRNTQVFSSIFTVVKNAEQTRAGLSAPVLFYEWETLHKLFPDEAAEKIKITSDHESARKIAAYIMEKKPFFTAVVFNEPDSTGHSLRWGSKAYYAKLTELDSFAAIIVQAVKDAGIYDNTVFMISSDHGGTFWGHGYNILKQKKIPLIIYGKGIKEGYIILSPASICDIAPTMASIMGLEIPPEWTGKTLKGIYK